MRKSDFHYELPPELVAQGPPADRSAGRLLLLDAAQGQRSDRQVRDLPELLRPGDLLVFNDTRVLPARLFGRKDSGGEIEVLIERVLGPNEARVQARASKPLRPGREIAFADGVRAEVVAREGEYYRLRFKGTEPVETLLERIGHVPLPPYIRRPDELTDAERYQTVFARVSGAVAAPTAGLDFDSALLAAVAERGVAVDWVTLHVGAGTFQPMRADDPRQHQMHSEWLNVGAGLVEHVRRTRAAGGRVVAVGTTVVRALEAAMRDGELHPYAGETRIFILPGYRIRSVDALVTNFHLPESTLLMLVSAFAGRERVLAAYRHAVA